MKKYVIAILMILMITGSAGAWQWFPIASSIVNDDLTHSPDGNSVFDALALKFDITNDLVMNGKSVLYLPTQATYTNSLIVGDGGKNTTTHAYNSRGAWVSGTSYIPYDTVTSVGKNYLNYVATSGTTAPASDTAHWLWMDDVAQELAGTWNGLWNTFVGINAGVANATGNMNVFIGDSSGRDNINGDQNTFVGSGTGSANTSGFHNAFIGAASGGSNTIGISNSFLGCDSGLYNTTGNWNTFIGTSAGSSNLIGHSNTYVGAMAGGENENGVQNVAVGKTALASNLGDNLTAVGFSALYSNTTGAGNTAVGNSALTTNISGLSNTAVGDNALYFNTGSLNTAIGGKALYTNAGGANNTANGYDALYSNTSGGYNVGIGHLALYSNTTASNNVAVGESAGYNTGVALTTNSNSVFLGMGANTSVNNLSNVIAIGYQAQATQSNEAVLGNSSITKTMLYGDTTVNAGSLTVGNNIAVGTTAASNILFKFSNSSTGLVGSSSLYGFYSLPYFAPTGTINTYGFYNQAILINSSSAVTNSYGYLGTLYTATDYLGAITTGWTHYIHTNTYNGSRPASQYAMYVSNQGMAAAVSAKAFVGGGLDDLTLGAATTYTGTVRVNYKVQIECLAGGDSPCTSVDMFKWSEDNGATWYATGVAITGAAQTLTGTKAAGLTITFGATTGHTVNDYWTFHAENKIGMAVGLFVAAQTGATLNYDIYMSGSEFYAGATKTSVGAYPLCWDGSGASYWGGCSGGSSGAIMCWKTATSLGYCTMPLTNGACTCN